MNARAERGRSSAAAVGPRAPGAGRPSAAARKLGAAARGLGADRSGAVIVLVAVAMVVTLGMVGLVTDVGVAVVNKARLDRAVDAAVLKGAGAMRQGTAEARDQAMAMARANGVTPGDGTSLNVSFGTNSLGEATVTMTATRMVGTHFMRVLGIDELDVGSSATAAVPPVDLVMVLDQSGSLASANAWDDLQAAAKQFVGNFDETMDQLGLVSFQIRGTNRFSLSDGFRSPIEDAIDGMSSAGDTNVGEGLRLGWNQLQLPAVRDRSVKVLVFFTDGRPTAFRGSIGAGGPNDGGPAEGPFGDGAPDRVLAVYTTADNVVRGLFEDPESLPTDQVANPPDSCDDVTVCENGWNEDRIRDKGRQNGIDLADIVRESGVIVYTIGLGDPTASNPLAQPDLDYLRLLANEDGVADGSQPKGKMFFAPSAAELRQVFDLVAQDILVRLSG